MNHPRTVLGFDFGLRRIGVAAGQQVTGTATPLATVAVTANEPDWAAIGQLIQAWRPAALIVGRPVNMDGTEHTMTHAAEAFASELEARFELAVYPVDERLTSLEASRILAAAGKRAKAHSQTAKQDVDKVAAQLIVQTWLTQEAERPTQDTHHGET